jgi:hypothetical protein
MVAIMCVSVDSKAINDTNSIRAKPRNYTLSGKDLPRMSKFAATTEPPTTTLPDKYYCADGSGTQGSECDRCLNDCQRTGYQFSCCWADNGPANGGKCCCYKDESRWCDVNDDCGSQSC